jgi:transketolase
MTATTTAADLRAAIPGTQVPDEVLRLLVRCTGDEKHSSAATSPLDVEWVLYDRVLRLRPDTVDDPDRDRFLLSKGHGPAGYYAVLAAKGYLDPDLLPGFLGPDSPLGGHPDRLRIPAVEASTGSLGHGLPMAVGVTLGLRARRSTAHTYVLCGDAELGEGSNWEAAAVAVAHGLERLTCIVVDNGSRGVQPGAIAPIFAAFGWGVVTVDGRDHDALDVALRRRHGGRPSLVVADVTRRADGAWASGEAA